MKHSIEQQNCIQHLDGPSLIHAGAGVGKTRVLSEKIIHILNKNKDFDSKILALSFSIEAANELTDRVLSGIGRDSSFKATTFHAFALSLLRKNLTYIDLPKKFKVLSAAHREQYFKQFDANKFGIKPSQLALHIAMFKHHLLSVSMVKSSVKSPLERYLSKIYEQYQHYILDNASIDFEDMLFLANDLLVAHPHIAEDCRSQFQYILVDEFQDTNFAQSKLLFNIFDKTSNITAVGDFNQLIYSWRGASLNSFKLFKQHFDSVKEFNLLLNYRSSDYILDMANGFMSRSIDHEYLALKSNRRSNKPVTVCFSYNQDDMNSVIVDQIHRLKENQRVMYSDIAILFRTNKHINAMQSMLKSEKIPSTYHDDSSSNSFIEAPLLFLKCIHAFNNVGDYRELFKSLLLYVAKGVGKKTLDKLMLNPDYDTVQKCSYPFISEAKQLSLKMQALHQHLLCAYKLYHSGSSFFKSIQAILNYYFDQIVGLEENPRRESIIQIFMEITDQYESLEHVLDQFDLMNQSVACSKSNGVHLMTMHQAKGKEYPVVFVVGFEEGSIPHDLSDEHEEIQKEERRLFYVSLTRAKDYLYLMYSHYDVRAGASSANDVSRYFKDLPRKSYALYVTKRLFDLENVFISDLKKQVGLFHIFDLSKPLIKASNVGIQYYVGQKLHHKKWGDAKIIDIKGEGINTVLTLKFVDSIKSVQACFAPLVALS